MNDMTAISRMSRDIKSSAALIGRQEARFLVGQYYKIQEDRMRDDLQLRNFLDTEQPAAVLAYLKEQHHVLENQLKGALDKYSAAQPVGQWMRSIVGIGPVLAAGFIAHIDIQRAETASQIWAFAGLDPTKSWSKGQKRPHNAELKTLSWKAGECFVKVSGHEDDYYGKVYLERKAMENAKNDAGEYAERAAEALSKKRFGDDTKAKSFYAEGKLPPAHIHARAKRYAVKLFISHLHQVWRTLEGLPVREPYPIAHMGHAHLRLPPNFPMMQA